MRRYTAAQARERLAEVLDAAERGRPVVVERRGVRFIVQRQAGRGARRARPRRSLIASMDPAVANGRWTWNWGARGLRFARRRSSG